MLKLKLQYFGHLMRRADSLEKTLMLGKIEGRRRRGRQRMRWLDGITDQWTWVCVNSRSWWWTGRPAILQFMGWQRVRHDWATELNWYLREITKMVWLLVLTFFHSCNKCNCRIQFIYIFFDFYFYYNSIKFFHLFLRHLCCLPSSPSLPKGVKPLWPCCCCC